MNDKRSEPDIKKDIEALLFASGKRMHIDEISKICKIRDPDKTTALLDQLFNEINSSNSSLIVINEHPWWKLTVRDQHMDVVKGIVTETELTKTLIETLAIIAYKAPVMQSEIIKIRTNKAYEHIRDLEELKYLRCEKKGRSKLITLGEKFYEYFDIDPSKLKDTLSSFEKIEESISAKEKFAESEIENQKKKKLMETEDEDLEIIEKSVEEQPIKAGEEKEEQKEQKINAQEQETANEKTDNSKSSDAQEPIRLAPATQLGQEAKDDPDFTKSKGLKETSTAIIDNQDITEDNIEDTETEDKK